MICFGQIRQTNKSLTYCIKKNVNIAKIYFCFPCSNGGVLVIMRTIASCKNTPILLYDLLKGQYRTDIQ